MKTVIKNSLIFFLSLLAIQLIFFVLDSNTFLPSPLEVLKTLIIQFEQGSIAV